MTLDKAIEILELSISDPDLVNAGDLFEAQKLGIEANKRFRALREVIRVPFTDLLPGEEPE
ncbi:hypothetical protein ES708_34462 [subsurface metagenome]